MLRIFLISALIACCLLAMRGHANAAVELCPAQVSDWHRLDADSSGALYDFVLQADSARTVRGKIVAATNTGYVSFPFPDTILTLDEGQYSTPQLNFLRDQYLSSPLYVRFPAGVRDVTMWWVTTAQTTGESIFGWDTKGSVSCALGPPASTSRFANKVDSALAKRTSPMPYDLSKLPASGTQIATAQIAAAPGDTSCATPFADATVPGPKVPQWPYGFRLVERTTVLIEVTVGADGALEDAWVYQPSVLPAFDLSALAAAKQSKYKGGIAFCQPAPAEYLYRANFDPH